MPFALVVLRRFITIRKAEWRLPETRRTLDAIEIAAPLARALSVWSGREAAIIEADLDGEARSRSARAIERVGVFEVRGTALQLDGEACARLLPTPRRASRPLPSLVPNRPLRVVLNGKADWDTGRFYYLLDYHLVLRENRDAAPLETPLVIDLQADLT